MSCPATVAADCKSSVSGAGREPRRHGSRTRRQLLKKRVCAWKTLLAFFAMFSGYRQAAHLLLAHPTPGSMSPRTRVRPSLHNFGAFFKIIDNLSNAFYKLLLNFTFRSAYPAINSWPLICFIYNYSIVLKVKGSLRAKNYGS